MSTNPGTLVIAPIRPNDSADVYPTAHANEILGGWHSVADLAALAAIPAERLQTGMACWVIDQANPYRWDGAAWQIMPVAGAPGSVWRNGSGAPSNALGIDGDYYLNDANGDVYKKTSGTYSIVGNIKGATGSTGATGPTGPTGPAGPVTIVYAAGMALW